VAAGAYVFVMDPIDRINIQKDSTFALMLEAQKRGHPTYYALVQGLELLRGEPRLHAQPIELRRKEGDHYTLGAPEYLRLDEATAVFMRKDPPFDVDYLMATYVLDRVDRTRVVMVNDPRSIRDANEKLFALEFQSVVPESLVAHDVKRLRAFVEEKGDVVVKPLTGAGGSGVVRLVRGDKNINSILELLTREGKSAIVAQAYLPQVTEGDRRVILLDGRPIGVINRRPRSDELRSNMHAGGTAEKAALTDRDREICAVIGPELSRRGLIFVGIDVIGGMLTEINVTSPTGIQEIDRFDGVCLEAEIIDWVEKRSKKA
jgi:glutathione synthase